MKDQEIIDKIKEVVFPCWGFEDTVQNFIPYIRLISDFSERLGFAWVTHAAAKDRLIEFLPPNPHSLPKEEKKHTLGTWYSIENQLLEYTVLSFSSAIENLMDGIKVLLDVELPKLNKLNEVKNSKAAHELIDLANVIKHDGGRLYSEGGRAAKNLIKNYNYPANGLCPNSFTIFECMEKDLHFELYKIWVFGLSLLDYSTKNTNPWLSLPDSELMEIMRTHLIQDFFHDLDLSLIAPVTRLR